MEYAERGVPCGKPLLASWARIVRRAPSKYEREVLASNASKSADIHRLLRDHLTREIVEVLCVVCLGACNEVLALDEVARGSRLSVVVTATDVFRMAVAYGANGVVLAHNHPSGDPEPSAADLDITEKLARAGRTLQIDVVDHVIIGSMDRYVSLLDRGLPPFV